MGGNTLSTESKTGNKFHKYMLRKYGTQLFIRDNIDEFMDTVDTCGLITSNHSSNRVNGVWHNRLCSDCGKHGHSKGQNACLKEQARKAEKANNNIATRHKRKLEEREALGK